MEENKRLKTLLYNAVSLLIDDLIELYEDPEDLKNFLEEELGCSFSELKLYGIDIAI